jgi:hypothetical protein
MMRLRNLGIPIEGFSGGKPPYFGHRGYRRWPKLGVAEIGVGELISLLVLAKQVTKNNSPPTDTMFPREASNT